MSHIIKQNKKLKKLAFDIAELAQYLWQKGWAERNAGNISVNIDHLIKEEIRISEDFPFYNLESNYPHLASMYFFITGTGKRMRDIARKPLQNALLIKLNEKGNGYWIITQKVQNKYNFKPTSELPTHLKIHQMVKERGSSEKVIIHTHANELVALTHLDVINSEESINKIIWGMHPESMVFVPKGVGFVPYTLPGTEEIASKTIKAFKNHDIVIWEKHGVFAIGDSIFDTFDNIDIVAKSAQIYFTCKSTGNEPEGLSEKQLDELKELVKKFQSNQSC